MAGFSISRASRRTAQGPWQIQKAISMAHEIANDADLQHATAMTLLATLRAQR
jgi:hypothetical protein